MKKRGKRLISLLLVAALCIVYFPSAFAVSAEQTEENVYAEDIAILKALGVIRNYEEGGYYAANPITRGEVAYMLCNMLNIAVDGSDYLLEEGGINWAEAAMNTAMNFGIFTQGDWEQNIIAQDLITVLIRAMGYELQAVSLDGYPNGYISAAVNIGLTDGIHFSYDEEISKGAAAKMFMNAGEIDIMKQSGTGSNTSYEIAAGQNMLSEYLKVTKADGKVTGTEISYLDREGETNHNYVEIDGESFIANSEKVNDFLGYRVTYYKKQRNDGTTEVVYLTKSKRQGKSILIAADDLLSYSNNTYRYYDGPAQKDIKIDPSADVIYNQKFAGALTNEQYIPASGSVELTDTDNDGGYDLVLITSVQTLVVQTYNSATSMLYDKYGSLSIKIDESDAYSHISIKDEKGIAVSVSQLNPMDVVSMIISLDNKAVSGTVSRNTVTGTISALNENNNGKTEVTIDRKTYSVCQSYTKNGDITLRTGLEGTFYLDINGEIAAVVQDLSANDIGYIVKFWNDEAFPEKLMIKIFLANGTFKTMEAEGSLNIDGTYYKDMEKAAAALNILSADNKKLIRYKTNGEGKLTLIDTPEYNKSKETEESLHKTHEAELLRWKNYPRIFGNKIAVDDRTYCFSVPKNGNIDDEKNYEILPLNYFSNDGSYEVEGYEIGTNHGAAAAIVMYDVSRGTELNKDSEVAMVGKISLSYDEDEGMSFYKLYCYGTEVKELWLDENAVVSGVPSGSGAEEIKKGDIIRYSTNKNGRISRVSKIYDYETNSRTSITDPEGGETVFGYAMYKNLPYIEVSTQKPEEGIKIDDSDLYIYRSDLFKIYIYNEETDSTVRSATAEDILTYDNAVTDCSTVFINTRYSDARSIFIVR